MTVSQATARQPSLITPLNSLLLVLDLTGEIIDFTFTNTDLNNQHEKKRWSIVRQVLHHIRPRVSHLTNDNYCVNAAPCRMLAWGKSLLNVKSCVSPTGLDHSKNRETVYLDHCHQTEPEAGGTEMTIKCPKCGTQLPVRSRLNPFGNLGSLGGWTPGSTNVRRATLSLSSQDQA